jgi:hypothetical protein
MEKRVEVATHLFSVNIGLNEGNVWKMTELPVKYTPMQFLI